MVSPVALMVSTAGLVTVTALPSKMPLPLPSVNVPPTRAMVALVGGLRPTGKVGVPAARGRITFTKPAELRNWLASNPEESVVSRRRRRRRG